MAARLLHFYQKQRLIREIGQDELALTQIQGKIRRQEKCLANKQKEYSGLFAQLEKQAQMMQNNATIALQNMFGFGMNSVNPMNLGGMNAFVMGEANNFMKNVGYQYAEGKAPYKIDDAMIEKLWTHSNKNGGRFMPQLDSKTQQPITENRKLFGVGNAQDVCKYDGFKEEDVQLFKMAVYQAQQLQQQAQMFTQQKATQISQNVSIWLEANKAQLEAEQDAVLSDLTYESEMLELDKAEIEARLERSRKELEAHSSAFSESNKDVPKFGLG